MDKTNLLGWYKVRIPDGFYEITVNKEKFVSYSDTLKLNFGSRKVKRNYFISPKLGVKLTPVAAN